MLTEATMFFLGLRTCITAFPAAWQFEDQFERDEDPESSANRTFPFSVAG
jgi:hypothetical protein